MSDLSDCCYGKGDIRRKVSDDEWPAGTHQDKKDAYEVLRQQEEQRQYPSDGMGFGPEGDGVELCYRARQAEARYRYDLWQFAVDALDRAQGIPPPGSFENIQWPQFTFETKESTAKPSLPALTRQAGEKYKGLGFCSE